MKNPQHPYTQALINSLPNFETNTIKSIEGQPPSIYEKIDGCSFNPRCKDILEICQKDFPTEKELAPCHKIKCWAR